MASYGLRSGFTVTRHPRRGFEIKLAGRRETFHAETVKEVATAIDHYFNVVWHGEKGNRDCPLCDAYRGRSNPLPSEQFNTRNTKKIMGLARKRFGRRAQVIMEHGHYWVNVHPEDPDDDDQLYDVVDIDTADGFDFERVS